MFVMAVILEDMRDLTKTLATLKENNMINVPKQYVQFVSVYKECEERYKKESEEIKTKYPTLDEYIKDKCGYEYDESRKDYGYWEKLNVRWDNWLLCGKDSMERFECEEMPHGYCKIKDFNKEIDWEEYNKAIRIWEIVVERQPLKDGEEKPIWCKKELLIKYFGTKEHYAIVRAARYTFAFVYEGKWYAKGSADWLGSNVPSEDIIYLYVEKFMQIINDPKNQELYIALVCWHI